ncbi:hypothetical protein MA16_Dca007166 [Dendrobium catenatum]|uniref:Uncharacterized protein n=1 Tax=Dendrobium catenatum TaxID=906689 RepID=A0A2I0W437_9ASPA|nr:hypothetical protein MA16_Dca007166 [Dendrobium catenatum]
MDSGEEPSRGLIKNIFNRRTKKVTVGPARTPATQPQPATQPSPTLGASSPQFYSADPRFPSLGPGQSTPFYPYYTPPPYAGAPPTYPFPPYALPYYPTPPHQPTAAGPSTAVGPSIAARPSITAAAEQETDGRMLITPEGDTFNPSKQPTHKIRDIIRSRFDAPYVSWKKKEYTWLREIHVAAGEGSFGGSVEFSEYCIWSQAIEGMQHGRVYGLGAQAQAYEKITSSIASSFASSFRQILSRYIAGNDDTTNRIDLTGVLRKPEITVELSGIISAGHSQCILCAVNIPQVIYGVSTAFYPPVNTGAIIRRKLPAHMSPESAAKMSTAAIIFWAGNASERAPESVPAQTYASEVIYGVSTAFYPLVIAGAIIRQKLPAHMSPESAAEMSMTAIIFCTGNTSERAPESVPVQTYASEDFY